MNAAAQPLPTPWRYQLEPRYGNARITAKGNQLVAVVWSGRRPDPAVVEAHAKLLHAAPALATALRAMVDAYVDTYGDEGGDAPENVKAALKALAAAGR